MNAVVDIRVVNAPGRKQATQMVLLPSDCRAARNQYCRRREGMSSKHKLCLWAAAGALIASSAAAQVGVSTSASGPAARPAMPSPAPVTAPGDMSPLLGQIQQAARTTTADVSLLTIRKWKVGNDVKNDASAKAEAIQRNLTIAMPTILSQVQAAPNDFAANFKLYRTLGVLYDVMSSLAESAGAFGSRSEFEPLATDLNRIDEARRALGDRLETLATAKDAEIARLQNQINLARATPAQPKKVIVDEDEKKPAKKPAKKKPAPPAATQDSATQQNH
jgi:hypothetical protein